MPTELLDEVVAFVVLLGLSGFFSGSETAIFALQEVELEEMERVGNARERAAAALARHPYRTLVTLLLGNMVANVALSTVATTSLLRTMGSSGLAVAIPSVTVLLLVFGEILPKTLGLRYRHRIASGAAPLIRIFAWLLGPIRVGLENFAGWVSGKPRPAALSREELGTLMDMARADGVLNAFESSVLSRILRFSTIPLERVLRPRVEVVGVSIDAGAAEAARLFQSRGWSRLPVYEDDLDHIVGVLYLKDLLTCEQPWEEIDLVELMRAPYFVPESKPADELFKEFQRRRVHFAIVVGEHGGMEGIVTMEDLLEELVGEIEDESDAPDARLETLGPGSWRVHAGIELDDLGEAIGVSLEEGEEAVTLAGLLESELGRVPEVGDVVQRHGFEFRVLTARPNRPLLIRARRLPEAGS